MIAISTPAFDLNGSLILHNSKSSDITTQSRRVSRTKTLDGGVAVDDLGFAHGDRTFLIDAERPTREIYDRAEYLHQNYPLLMLSCEEGLFLGAIESISHDGGTLALTFLVKSKESN